MFVLYKKTYVNLGLNVNVGLCPEGKATLSSSLTIIFLLPVFLVIYDGLNRARPEVPETVLRNCPETVSNFHSPSKVKYHRCFKIIT